MKNLLAWFKDEEGQGMVEYALIVGLISIVAIAILVAVGGRIRQKFQAVDDALATEPTTA
ncbi:MAG TPA: Flp family type IVb pilin [Oscillospiraceae bacterium]|jgi:pilus assembly protein Flp/PilA|nr:Flp family type IVb pilin [Oscillospiraceae bacterium]